jgi:RTX calcium-binding nonapeptide repeat (4 copies)
MADDTFDQATNLSDFYLEKLFSTTDSVGAGDTDDYYRFYNLYGTSQIYAVLNGLSADADLYIYDQNQNLVASSTTGSNNSEVINATLQGNKYYYIKVHSFAGANTNYGLLLLNDYAGSSLATARDNGTSWGQSSSQYWAFDKITFSDHLDYRDNVDIIKFQMEANGTISLRKLSSGSLVASMQLLDQNGSVLANLGASSDALNLDRFSAAAGTYYVKFAQASGSGDYQYRITSDYAGDTTATARSLGNITGTSRRFYDMVGGTFLPTYEDTSDLYKFTLNQTAPLDLSLTIPATFAAPTFDANLQIAQDSNSDGFITSNEVLFSSSNPSDDKLSITLGAGTYYAQVVQNGAYTSYQLDFDSDFDANAGDPQAYNNMSKARVAGALTGETFFNDGFGISAGDFADYFKFQMTTAGQFSAAIFLNGSPLSRSTSIPSLSIIRDQNNNQRFDTGEQITPFSQGSLTANLAAGTYFLRTGGVGEQASYQLRLLPDYAGDTPGAARSFASITGATPAPQTFKDYIEDNFSAASDENDLYRFNLASTYQVSLNTTGVAGEDLALSLIRDANNNGLIDVGEILAISDVLNSPTESITRSLAAGQYFARVQGINGGTNYTLTANFLGGSSIVGNSGNNLLTGGAGNDTISGLAGNDTLVGNAGSDILVGGTGNDSQVGGTGNDIYYLENIGDVLSETSALATEIDTVRSYISYTLGANLERLSLQGTSNLNASGNSLNNLLVGNAGNNSLNGLGGNDTLLGEGGSDTLNGGGGIDSLVGGAGGDVYLVDSTGDTISETSTLASEIDTVRAYVSYAISANLERLSLQGAVNINATGNSLNNLLVGNSGNNILNGQSGNDTLTGNAGNDVLVGASGNDVLTGGSGNDSFNYFTGAVFVASEIGVDLLTDFARTAGNIDKIKLSSTTFSAGTDFASVGSDALAANSAAHITFSSSTGRLFYNQNGSAAGLGAGGQFATLSDINGNPITAANTLLATDFTIG